jgi:integrase
LGDWIEVPRKAEGLTAAKVRTAKPGRYGDGGGLYLLVRAPESRFWLFRYTVAGKMREMGLGAATGRSAVSLVDARAKARTLYDAVRAGRDPLADREAEKLAEASKAAQAAIRAKTFRDVAAAYIEAHEASWRNAKHRQQWGNTLETYAYPVLGALAVADVDTAAVMSVLEPIWRDKAETASRVRGRIETVLDYAGSRGWRSGDNPARWRGHIANMLPKKSKIQPVEHHPALPWQQIGAFLEELGKQNGLAAQALRFAILTAARTGEVVNAKWSEFDTKAGVWTVPASRMKAAREHRVPLSDAALSVLTGVTPLRNDSNGGWVFPGVRPGRPLSNMAFLMLLRRMEKDDLTAHGFRSTFRDWCGEATNHPREVAEQALAHTLGDKTEAAYRRGDLFEKRRRLMEDWAKFCERTAVTADVLPIRA